jgi:hypothetical protein
MSCNRHNMKFANDRVCLKAQGINMSHAGLGYVRKQQLGVIDEHHKQKYKLRGSCDR